ncbi:GAF domain-containing protein [Pseudanabaena sp. FACHB-1998]|uniref:GAF domain-containing protein n=1 Tax=Pseudanabaena sp. FACHB-1998 TaxID=2692858 RepID=UPI0016805561|nr:GAF domain-containing protein [Pseudanabaena sp. FACHB-1998]MBD2176791.1 GAF domain-containing protein [Pseudanabaena sp. FACHB-1998]
MLNLLTLSIVNVLNTSSNPDVLFKTLLPEVGAYLDCDRCFLYLREPNTGLGKVPFCWVRNDSIPMIYDEGWKLDSPSLPDRDPMFAAALRAEPSIAIEDVETASLDILNKQFERENFGHRALIHAHICYEGQLWGVLQPSVFGRPRQWTQLEQAAIEQLVQAITPSVTSYVMSYNPTGAVQCSGKSE